MSRFGDLLRWCETENLNRDGVGVWLKKVVQPIMPVVWVLLGYLICSVGRGQ